MRGMSKSLKKRAHSALLEYIFSGGPFYMRKQRERVMSFQIRLFSEGYFCVRKQRESKECPV